MTESRDYLEMTYKSINCFADDGKLDVNELDEIFNIAKRVLVPTNKELEGRGLMILFSRGLSDLVLTTIYCPLCDKDVQNHKKTEK